LLVSTESAPSAVPALEAAAAAPMALPHPVGQRQLVDTATGGRVTAPVYRRETLQPGMQLRGPAVIVEQDTTTVVSARFRASIRALGALILERQTMSTATPMATA